MVGKQNGGDHLVITHLEGYLNAQHNAALISHYSLTGVVNTKKAQQSAYCLLGFFNVTECSLQCGHEYFLTKDHPQHRSRLTR